MVPDHDGKVLFPVLSKRRMKGGTGIRPLYQTRKVKWIIHTFYIIALIRLNVILTIMTRFSFTEV